MMMIRLEQSTKPSISSQRLVPVSTGFQLCVKYGHRFIWRVFPPNCFHVCPLHRLLMCLYLVVIFFFSISVSGFCFYYCFPSFTPLSFNSLPVAFLSSLDFLAFPVLSCPVFFLYYPVFSILYFPVPSFMVPSCIFPSCMVPYCPVLYVPVLSFFFFLINFPSFSLWLPSLTSPFTTFIVPGLCFLFLRHTCTHRTEALIVNHLMKVIGHFQLTV